MAKPKRPKSAAKSFAIAASSAPKRTGERRSHVQDQVSTKPVLAKGPPWLFGRHAVIAALANSARNCLRLLATSEANEAFGAEIKAAVAQANRGRPQVELTSRKELDELLAPFSPGAIHQGIALQADSLPVPDLDTVLRAMEERNQSCLVILDQASDPHNIGAVMRSAAAFGAGAVIMTDRNAPDITPTMAKSACGAVERIPLVRITNLARTMAQLKEAGFWCIGLDGYAEATLASVDLTGKVALVMGAEGSGLRRLTRETCDILAKVPIDQAVESLNLSNATAIALYETARQKTTK